LDIIIPNSKIVTETSREQQETTQSEEVPFSNSKFEEQLLVNMLYLKMDSITREIKHLKSAIEISEKRAGKEFYNNDWLVGNSQIASIINQPAQISQLSNLLLTNWNSVAESTLLKDRDTLNKLYALLNTAIPQQSTLLKDALSKTEFKFLQYQFAAKMKDLVTINVSNSKILTDDFEKPFFDSGNFELPQIDTSYFGDFIVFDIFRKDSCLHGSKVLDVIKQTLLQLNQPLAYNKVHPEPVNYFAHKCFGDSIIKAGNQLGNNLQDNHIDEITDAQIQTTILDSAECEKHKNDDQLAPVNYISNLYFCYSHSNPSIISTSFVVNYNFVENLINTYPLDVNNQVTNYVTSVTNDDFDSLVENHILGKDKDGRFEPLYSYCKDVNEYGSVVVADAITDTTYRGMFSKSGINVTTFGKGTDWGLVNCTKCIADTEYGASFATPYVATLLFVAKAFWKSKGLNVSFQDARRRLIMATSLKSKFIGKVSTGGVVNFQKLTQTSKAYLMDTDDNIIPVDSIIFANFTDAQGDHHKEMEYKIFTDNDPDQKESYGGWYYYNGSMYEFDNKFQLWKKTDTPRFLNFSLELDDNSRTRVDFDQKNFSKKYKQFVILN
jgi:hypothetical protein